MNATVLLVEDEPGLVLTLSDLLRAAGYTAPLTELEDGIRQTLAQLG